MTTINIYVQPYFASNITTLKGSSACKVTHNRILSQYFVPSINHPFIKVPSLINCFLLMLILSLLYVFFLWLGIWTDLKVAKFLLKNDWNIPTNVACIENYHQLNLMHRMQLKRTDLFYDLSLYYDATLYSDYFILWNYTSLLVTDIVRR